MRTLGCIVAATLLLAPCAPVRSQLKQPIGVKELMADKLKNGQRLLEGMALGDFDKITQSAERLIQISKTTEWFVYRTPRYEMHTNEFRRAAETVMQKAREKNMDGVALGYFDMTLSCIRCHQNVRETRDARLPHLRPDHAAALAQDSARAAP
jgi:hypothetical protein